ncbi:MAG: hypothetical protein AAB729_01835, partial [Patescibacteria group bacterium]
HSHETVARTNIKPTQATLALALLTTNVITTQAKIPKKQTCVRSYTSFLLPRLGFLACWPVSLCGDIL